MCDPLEDSGLTGVGRLTNLSRDDRRDDIPQTEVGQLRQRVCLCLPDPGNRLVHEARDDGGVDVDLDTRHRGIIAPGAHHLGLGRGGALRSAMTYFI